MLAIWTSLEQFYFKNPTAAPALISTSVCLFWSVKDLCLHCPPHLLAYCSSPLRSSSPWCCPSAPTHSHSTPFPVAVHLFGFTFPVCVRARVSCFPSVQSKDTPFRPLWCLTFFLSYRLLLSPSLLLLHLMFDQSRKFSC